MQLIPAINRGSNRHAGVPVVMARLALSMILAASTTQFVSAADLYWDNSSTNNNWSNPGNWSTSSSSGDPMFDPVAPPGASDMALFNIDSLSTAQTVNLNGPQSAVGLVFRGTSGPIEINSGAGGPHTLSIGAGGIMVHSGAGGAGELTITAPTNLVAAQSWTNDSTSRLVVNGNIAGGSQGLTIGGSGDTFVQGILGTPGFNNTLTKTGTGDLRLNHPNNFRRATIAGGTLTVDGNNVLLIPGPLTFAGGTLRTIDSLNVFGFQVILNSEGGTIDIPQTLGTPIFTGNFTGSGSLTKISAGELHLWGTNSFTGGMTINGGGVNLASPAALPNMGDILVNSFAAIRLEANQPGTFNYGGSSQLLTLNGGNLVFIRGADDRLLRWNGDVDLTADSTVWGTGRISGDISGSGRLMLREARIELTGENTYAGGTAVNSDAVLIIADDSKLGSGGLTLDGGTLLTSGNIASSRAVILNPRPFHSPGGTIDTNGFNATFNGNLTGSGSLTKSGSGTLTLTSTNTYTGGTSVQNGRLTVNGSILGPVTVDSLGTLGGSGTIDGNVSSAGRVAPGNSPEILTIDGNYTQTADGTLEIEVGGLTAGTQHDKLVITGTATLAGLLEVPIINGFVPSANDQITFLSAAGGVTGSFDSFLAPNLQAVTNLGVKVIKMGTDVNLRFVERSNVTFTDPANADWQDMTSWSTGAVPDTDNIVIVGNNSPLGDQRVEVQSENAYADELTVSDPLDRITIGVHDGLSLSAAARGITIGNNGVIELGVGGMGGAGSSTLVGPTIEIEGGGLLAGNGTVDGDLLVGTSSSSMEATLSPGFSVGHLEVEGDYQQGEKGTLLIEAEGAASAGQFDTVAISGQAQLGGTLRLDASDMTTVIPGTSIDILTATDGIMPGTVFDDVVTVGNDDVFFAPTYLPGLVRVTNYPRGDMNRDGVLDSADVEEFALALMNPDAYFDRRFIFGSQSGNIDGMGGLDFDDIDDFAALLGLSSAAVFTAIEQLSVEVPEPGSSSSAVLGIVFAILRLPTRRGRRVLRTKSIAA